MFNFQKYYSEPLYLNSIAIMLNTISVSFFGLLFWIIAARTMSATDIGYGTAIISAGSLISTLSMFGLDSGLIRYLPTSKNRNELYSSSIIITFIASGIITILFLLGLKIFSPSLLFLRNGIFPIILILFISSLSLNVILYMMLIALRKGVLSFFYNIILGFRVPMLFIFGFLGLLGILYAFELAYILAFIFSIYIIYRLGVKFQFKLDIKSLKEPFVYSLGNYTASIFSTAAITIIPILIVNLLGAADCAYFYMAYSVASILFGIPSAISTSLFVEGSHEFPLKENVLKSLKFIIILLIPAILIVFLFGDKILLLFSKEFSEQSFDLLKLLVLSSLFSTIISVYTTIKRIHKDIKTINLINIISAVILILLGYILIIKYGLIGIGYAWLLNNIIISLVILYLVLVKERWFNEFKFVIN